MIEIELALQLILENCRVLPSQQLPLLEAVGHVVATPLVSDIDSPPFDKSMMDGFAVRSADILAGRTKLEIVERITAGDQPSVAVESGTASQIMTGAPMPNGADAVVMVEQTEELNVAGQSIVIIKNDHFRSGQNVLLRAAAMGCDEVIVPAGHLIRSEDVGLLAEAGCSHCDIIPKPSVSILATGDELVALDQKPAASQIRNSNGPMLRALASELCGKANDMGIGRDDRDELLQKIQTGLESDVLILSGGVSAGVADLVPSILNELGVDQIFHKVKIKPGKPIWFGIRKRESGSNTLVFGLPGNPVSTMVCFHVFVAEAMRKLAGRDDQTQYAVSQLTAEFRQRPGRTTYWPSTLRKDDTGWQLTPLDWKGSADLRTLARANAFAVFPGEKSELEPHEMISVLKID